MRKYGIGAVSAAALFLLLLLPVACLAFGGKVSYPDGTPAVGARVRIIMLHADDSASPGNGPGLDLFQQSAIDNGRGPGQSAAPHRQPRGKGKVVAVCDADGRFSFADQSLTHAQIQIKAPNGQDYSTVTLPVKAFQGGEVAVVLQRKK
ncbi:hypothetical protein GMSM_19360 [Geomonas sp. Red276]